MKTFSQKMSALLLAVGMTATAGASTVATLAAEENTVTTPAPYDTQVIVDECFDDYDVNYDAKSTTLASAFVIEANSIGSGYVSVQENSGTGNLHLKSHVFTQVYSTANLENGYTFSLDVFQVQGNQRCTIFLRAPKSDDSAYYETDGRDEGNACGKAGILLYCRNDRLEVNIKNYDIPSSDYEMIGENIFSFPLPEGVTMSNGTDYTNIKVVDTQTEMSIFVADQLICRIALSEPSTKGYARILVDDPCFRMAKIYDAEGTEVGSVKNPTVQCGNPTVGWATRVADMIVDNVRLLAHTPIVETQPETIPETAPETTPETIPETIPETDSETVPATTPETAPATQPETQPVTDPVTETETNATTTPTTDANTGATSDTDTTPAPENAGCSSVLSYSVLALMSIGAAAVAFKKKKE